MKSPREKFLIEQFPDHSKSIKARQIWKRQKVSDSTRLLIFVLSACFIGFIAVLSIVVFWRPEWDASPTTGLLIVIGGSSVLFFDVRKRAVMGYKELGRKIKYH